MKKFSNFKENAISRDQMRSVRGGVSCTITDQSTGQVMSDGGCASSNIDDCVGYSARDASSLAISTGHSMDYECH